jgi:hypothetical protein
VERENAFFKSSPVDEYHLPQMNSEKVFFGCGAGPIVRVVKKNTVIKIRNLSTRIYEENGENFLKKLVFWAT